MDRILSDYQYHFIFLSYGVFFIFFGAISLFYGIKYWHSTKKLSLISSKSLE